MLVRLLAACLLGLATAIAGCAAPAQGLEDTRVQGDGSSSWYVEHSSTVRPDHRAQYEARAPPGATTINATLLLSSADAGLGTPGAPAARLTVRIAGPDNATLAIADVDPSRPVASAVAAAPGPGTYLVEVTGAGFSHELDGGTLGASYRVSIEVA